jgi:hypothetical protein
MVLLLDHSESNLSYDDYELCDKDNRQGIMSEKYCSSTVDTSHGSNDSLESRGQEDESSVPLNSFQRAHNYGVSDREQSFVERGNPSLERRDFCDTMEQFTISAKIDGPSQRHTKGKTVRIVETRRKQQSIAPAKGNINPTIMSIYTEKNKDNENNQPVFQTRKKSSRYGSSVYDRLTSSSTKNMERRRRLEREQQLQKTNNMHQAPKDRVAFKTSTAKSTDIPRTRKPRAPPAPKRREPANKRSTRNSLYSRLAETETYATARMKGYVEPVEEKPKPKKSKKPIQSGVFSRLAKQDTIASSRKTAAPSKVRPVLLTEYEKKQAEIRNKASRRKMKSSAALFENLNKRTTKSLIYRESDGVR